MYARKALRAFVAPGNGKLMHFLTESESFRFLPQSSTGLMQRFYSEKRLYERNKPHVNIGTIGHANHGKTTLTAAITKVLAEKELAKQKCCNQIHDKQEEKASGVSMDVAIIEYSTEERHYSHADCPGHADFIKSMIAGASGLDGAVLVVAATEGILPQTREHLVLARHIGLKHIVAFINKVDAADEEMANLVELEIRDLVTEMGYDGDNLPVIRGSALCALKDKSPEIGSEAVLKLLDQIETTITTTVRDLEKPFMMSIGDVYSISGCGTVVSGLLERGTLKNGDECEIIGYNKTVKSTITSIEMFKQTLVEGKAGDHLGALVRGVKRDEIRQGMVMCAPGTIKPCDHIEAQIYILNKEEGGRDRPLTNFAQLQLFSRTWDCAAQVTVPENNMVMPGIDATLVLKLIKPMVLDEDERFTIRDGSKTLGTGVVTKILEKLTPDERLELFRRKIRREKRDAAKNRNSTPIEIK